MIAPVAAAIAEPTSAHLSERRSLSAHYAFPISGSRPRLLQPAIPRSAVSLACTKPHPPAYGLEPLPVRLVIHKPPVPTVLQIINDTTAIRVEGVDQNRAFYKLSLRNLSPKNITGLLLSMANNGGSSSQSEIGTSKHPVIAGGDLHQMMLGLSAPDAAPVAPIIIAAVTFDDGSFEGSAELATEMEAQRLGVTVQERRVSALVQAILDSGDRDDAAMISAIRSQVNALRS